MQRKEVYTTGEAAEICNLSQQTIIRCVDQGRMKGAFRIPGSKFRRIPREVLRKFMDDNNLPKEWQNVLGPKESEPQNGQAV